jgi:hypothetical protein
MEKQKDSIFFEAKRDLYDPDEEASRINRH